VNCKQGELAIFVRSVAGNEGKIVKCLRPATQREIALHSFNPNEECWVIDREVPSLYGFPVNIAYDYLLRPIRPEADPVVTDVVDEVSA